MANGNPGLSFVIVGKDRMANLGRGFTLNRKQLLPPPDIRNLRQRRLREAGRELRRSRHPACSRLVLSRQKGFAECLEVGAFGRNSV